MDDFGEALKSTETVKMSSVGILSKMVWQIGSLQLRNTSPLVAVSGKYIFVITSLICRYWIN